MQSAAYVWAKILQALEDRFGPIAVAAWFDDAELIGLNEDALILYSPSDFRQETIRRTCKEHIEEILKEQFHLNIAFQVWTDAERNKHRQSAADVPLWTYNPHFCFSSFVPGEANRIPLKAAMHVAEHLSDSVYNPLFLYGPPGVGKTHLLYAIANQVSQTHPDAKIVYVKGDQFTNELVQAILRSSTADFKRKYREADLLLVDDIQFIAGKEATQEEFFHTFNNLYELHKQIVLTSDRVPADMPTLEDRLKGRFGEGVMIKITPPDADTRRQIILAKAEQLGLCLDGQIVDFLAKTLCDNVRQIEGGLRKIRAFQELSGMTLTLANVAKTVEDVQTSASCAVVTPDLVARYVCRYYGVEEAQLKGLQRSKNITEPRHVAMYLIRHMTALGLTDIGKYFQRDRGTVIHAISKVQAALTCQGSGMADKLEDIKHNIEANV